MKLFLYAALAISLILIVAFTCPPILGWPITIIFGFISVALALRIK